MCTIVYHVLYDLLFVIRIEDGPSVPSECAVKVFKTMLNEFKNRDRFGKQNPRKFVRLWAEKEMHNLKR